jgi:predicted dinucleotide-binding enzyme
MRIGILGAGNVGTAVATAAVRAGHEEMAFLNITLNARNGWSWQSGWKLVGPVGSAA